MNDRFRTNLDFFYYHCESGVRQALENIDQRLLVSVEHGASVWLQALPLSHSLSLASFFSEPPVAETFIQKVCV